MTPQRIRAAAGVPETVTEGFARIRREMEAPGAFPPEVLAAAEAAASAGPAPRSRLDMTDVDFVTVDPPGSRDLDQAMAIAPDGDGWLLRYAIADVGAFVPAGGPVDREAWARGETVYSPDLKVPLYPPVLSEGAASLLPDGPRPAIVISVPVAADGEAGRATVMAGTILSRARLAYGELADRPIPNLREMGTALAAAAERRGASQIDLPEQEVEPAGTPEGFALTLRAREPSEDWNAQVSLCANVAVARLLWGAGAGLFRVMAEPDPARLEGLRAAAAALGFAVPEADGLHALAGAAGPRPALTAFHRGARAGGGAGYRFLRTGDDPPWHAAVAAPYAHATAPLRRLADRYVLEAALAASAGTHPPDAVRDALAALPPVMDAAETRSGRIEAAAIDLLEAHLMRARVGEVFDAVVTETGPRGARIQLRDPPVRASVPEVAAAPGTSVRVRLVEADPSRRVVRFAAVT